MTRPSRFLILFEGRAGSSYLIDRLDSSPHIEAHGEVLDEYVVYRNSLDGRARAMGIQGAESGPLVLPATADAPARQLERAMNLLLTERDGIRSIGFKTKLRSLLEPLRFAQLLRALDVRVVHLTRRNVVKQVISSMNAARLYEATGRWNLYRASDQLPPFDVDPEAFDRALAVRETAERELAKYVGALAEPAGDGAQALRILRVDYEDILAHESDVHGRVQDHLGVPRLELSGQVLKNTHDDLRRVVRNLDELRERYHGTRYARWLESAPEAAVAGS